MKTGRKIFFEILNNMSNEEIAINVMSSDNICQFCVGIYDDDNHKCNYDKNCVEGITEFLNVEDNLDDNVNHPKHYTMGKYETIDIIEDTVEDFPSYLVGNILKYISRYRHKNGLEDLKKAKFYLDKLVLTNAVKENNKNNKK